MECGCNCERRCPPPMKEISETEKVIMFRAVTLDATITEEEIPPVNGRYRNVVLKYLSSGNVYIYSSDGIPVLVPKGEVGTIYFDDIVNRPTYNGEAITSSTNIVDLSADLESEAQTRADDDNALESAITLETSLRTSADTSLSSRISSLSEALSSEVTTRQTSDEANANAITAEAEDRAEADNALAGDISDLETALASKQDTLTEGVNITIENNVISATDTTYGDFIGTDGVAPGTNGLVPAPEIADYGLFLKADGTWGTPPGATYTAGDNIVITGNQISAVTPVITLTDTDPGEGASLLENHFIAVYDGS